MKEKNEALQFAMKLIGLRMRSVLEIKTRLEKKGFGTKIINEVLRDLEKYRSELKLETEKSIEGLKSSLRKTAYEHEILFSKK